MLYLCLWWLQWKPGFCWWDDLIGVISNYFLNFFFSSVNFFLLFFFFSEYFETIIYWINDSLDFNHFLIFLDTFLKKLDWWQAQAGDSTCPRLWSVWCWRCDSAECYSHLRGRAPQDWLINCLCDWHTSPKWVLNLKTRSADHLHRGSHFFLLWQKQSSLQTGREV